MKYLWDERRLEVITLAIFALLVISSLSILYISYNSYVEALLIHSTRTLEHEIVMFIASIILFFSLLIVYLKRDYFFTQTYDSTQGLETLLDEIKLSSDTGKIAQFKTMLKEKNHTEIYTLISKMINELQESKRIADEANEAKSLFLANMSHEMRTPINGIMGFTDFLKESKLNSEQFDFVHTIRQSSEKLLGVVEKVLNISNIERGQTKVEKEFFNIVNEFENMIETYALDASKKNIGFSIWIDPQFQYFDVKNDSEKIQQVLMNLLSNAIKFTDRDGEIELFIEKIDMTAQKTAVRFMVKDNGIGIEQSQQEKVFSAFTQADNSSTRAYGGTGLGLSIADDLVRMLGGSLSLESVLNEGSTFSFTLSMQQQKVSNLKKNNPIRIALYTGEDVKRRNDYSYLKKYFLAIENVSFQEFDTFVTCKDAPKESFDVLYLYYDAIDKDELNRLLARYGDEVEIVLLTKLDNRKKIADISPIFSQIIYRPLTFSKLFNSLTTLSKTQMKIKKECIEDKFSLKALVVEDNLVNQKVIVHTLKTLGIESDVAHDGEEAIEKFMEEKYDIIFMDIQMPIMNGVEASKKIVEYEKKYFLEHTPIVAVTTNVLKGDRELYLDQGMDEYIPKPIDRHKFVTVIKQFYETKESLNSSLTKDILLYKQVPTEAKIMSTILTKCGYSVTIANTITDFQILIEKGKHKAFVLDKVSSREIHLNVTEKLVKSKIPTLLFLENEIETLDKENYTYILSKNSSFSDISAYLEKILSI